MSVTDAATAVAAEEAGLVAQIATGDTGAPVAELYRRYGKRLYRFGVKHLGNEGLAEEMVQETFVRLWRAAGRFDPGKASVGTYLYVLARSAAVDIAKRPSSRPLVPASELAEPVQATDEDQILNSMVVREALDSLRADQAEVIRLAHEDGLTQTQIAERLNLPLGTVKTRTFYGMRALRTALAARGFHAI